jgi:DNA-binding NarL/FixJ family response regulator
MAEVTRRLGSGVASLSARQLEIAELVAEGMTNREIAQTLLLSEKTVETHLSAVFTKLGVSSRTAVGLAVARHHLEE